MEDHHAKPTCEKKNIKRGAEMRNNRRKGSSRD
jgi:hypothetical protein